MADEPLWRVSGYDGQAHAFYTLGEVFSEALCDHSAPAEKLRTEEGRRAQRCLACLLIFGSDLADRIGDRDRYQP